MYFAQISLISKDVQRPGSRSRAHNQLLESEEGFELPRQEEEEDTLFSQ